SARPRTYPDKRRCKQSRLVSTVELGREEKRRRPQDLIRPTQLPVLPLQLLQPLPVVCAQPRTRTLIDLRPANPLTHRLRRRTEHLSDRTNRLPLRPISSLALTDQPHRTTPHLRRILPRPRLLAHNSILSTDRACAKPGEVHATSLLRGLTANGSGSDT